MESGLAHIGISGTVISMISLIDLSSVNASLSDNILRLMNVSVLYRYLNKL